MTIKRIFYIFIFLLTFAAAEVFSSSNPNNQKLISVNYPPDKTVMEFDLLGVSLSITEGSVDLIRAVLNDEAAIKIVPDSEIECFSVRLSVGTNRLHITAFKKGKQVGEVAIDVFRRSDLVSAYRSPPPGFKKDFFHERGGFQCAPCHVMEAVEADKKPVNIVSFRDETIEKDGSDTAPVSSTCYSCHKKMTSYLYVHGPTSVWSCLSCHDPGANPKYATKKPDDKVCFNCHTEQKKTWSSKKYIHGPVNIGNCAICHSPHASDNPFNLVKSSWKLCVSCHAGKGTGLHIFGGALFEDGHPTRGRPDPVRIGKEISCASCHNPHASDFPRLWAFEAQNPLELCRRCHTKYFK